MNIASARREAMKKQLKHRPQKKNAEISDIKKEKK